MDYIKKRNETIYLMALTGYLLSVMLELTCIDSEAGLVMLVFKGLRYLAYAAALFYLIQDSYRKNEFYIYIILAIILVISMKFSGTNRMLFYFLMILAARDVSSTGIMKVALYVQGIVLLIFVIGSQIGIFPDYIFDATSRVRHGLGFYWTTTAPIMYFFWMMYYIYLRRDIIRFYEILILELINYWFYQKTDSRMSFLLSTVMLCFFLLARVRWSRINSDNQIFSRFFEKLSLVAPTLICVFALFLHMAYNADNHLWSRLNSLLSKRLALGLSAVQTYGISLFGTEINWVGYDFGISSGTYNYVDCSYLQILLNYGLIMLIVVIAIYTYLMYRAISNQDPYLVIILWIILIFSITEPRLMHLGFNSIPLLTMSQLDMDKSERYNNRLQRQQVCFGGKDQ